MRLERRDTVNLTKMGERVYPDNPFSKSKFLIEKEGLLAVLSMSKSGVNLYSFLIERGDKFLAHDGIAYLNPIEMTQFLDCTRKSVYNGIEDLILKDMLALTGRPGEYFFNPKYFLHAS